ncbi:MAG TPA: tRNA (guanosine(46)-N7)-methyltransferase TrmB [Sedimentisphaerales bacterium]|nr:tRNA (guanosine(46)-N7)-methyltransferase TrmB [Sedimentisphaerales bacterium]
MARVLKDYPNVAVKLESLEGRVDFGRVFGRRNPIHIELGSGKGTFLVNQALAQPDVDFLGIEWASRYYRYAVDRVGRWPVPNVRIIRADAAAFLAEYVPHNSVDCFHIYFPDPWPKRRHNKRRFFCDTNLRYLVRILKPAGIIRAATDHADYFQSIEGLVAAERSLERIEFTPAAGASDAELTGTNYERKYLAQGRAIFYIAVRKR